MDHLLLRLRSAKDFQRIFQGSHRYNFSHFTNALRRRLYGSIRYLCLVNTNVNINQAFHDLVDKISVPRPGSTCQAKGNCHRIITNDKSGAFLFILRLGVARYRVPVIYLGSKAIYHRKSANEDANDLRDANRCFFTILVTCDLRYAKLRGNFPKGVTISKRQFTVRFLTIRDRFRFVTITMCPGISTVAFIALRVPIEGSIRRQLVHPPKLRVPNFILKRTAMIRGTRL